MRSTKAFALSGGVVMLASLAVAGAAGTSATAESAPTVRTHTHLNSLNNSGVQGRASVESRGRWLDVRIDAHGLAEGLPHAQHIHFGAQAAHECPTSALDADRDFRLTTVEGVPAYGPVRVSLTTRGDTSPDSTLAVDRFPTAQNGTEHYHRQTRTQRAVARAIRRGEGVVVIHGVDYNDNGEYDFRAGKSELDPSLPAEATDPAACGVLHR